MRRRNTIAIGLILGVGVGFITLNILAYRHANSILQFSGDEPRTEKPESLSFLDKASILISGVSLPRPVEENTPIEFQLPYQKGLIECDDNIQIGYWYIPRKGASRIVLMFHSYAGEKSSMLQEASAFHVLGFSILMIDFRGSGASSENYTTIGYHEARDVSAALRFTKSTLQYTHLILYGQSMGAVAILRSIHAEGLNPEGIIIEGVFDEVLHTVEHRFEAMGVPSFPSAQLLLFWGGNQFEFDAFSHNPVTYATSVRCPAVFLHGTEDARARLSEGKRVYDAVLTVKSFREFEGLGHQSYLKSEPEKWRDAVKWLVDAADTKARHDNHQP